MNFLFSTAYLPPVEYFVNIIKAESVFIENYEHYIKQSYRNRCSILGANGKQQLIIPVIKVNGNKKVTNIIISQELLDDKDKEAIEDLVLTAVNRAMEKAEQLYEREMGGIAKGMMPGFPGMF